MSERYTVVVGPTTTSVKDVQTEMDIAEVCYTATMEGDRQNADRICRALNLLDDLESPCSPVGLPEPFDRDRAERRHIATQALVGILACPGMSGNADVCASDAVRYADALITRLNRD